MFDDTEIELLGSLRSPSRETIKANPNPYRKLHEKTAIFSYATTYEKQRWQIWIESTSPQIFDASTI